MVVVGKSIPRVGAFQEISAQYEIVGILSLVLYTHIIL